MNHPVTNSHHKTPFEGGGAVIEIYVPAITFSKMFLRAFKLCPIANYSRELRT